MKAALPHRQLPTPIIAMFLAAMAVSGCKSHARPQNATSQPAHPVSRTAKNGPLALTVSVDRDEVTNAQPITLAVTLETEKGVDVTLPPLGETIGEFLVKDTKDLPESGDDLVTRRSREYTLESCVPGACTIPAVKLEYTDARPRADGSAGESKGELATEPIPITVRMTLADVKGPVSLPWPWSYQLITWIVIVLVAMVLIAMAARWWRKHHTKAEAKAVRPPVPAHEWALAELDMLAAMGLIERGRVQEFYYRINAIVRGYIERRWGLMAGEQTSEEFIRALGRSAFLGDEHKTLLRRFVAACDPVKYAKQQPSQEEIDWVSASARDFILQTAQRAPTESAAIGQEAAA